MLRIQKNVCQPLNGVFLLSLNLWLKQIEVGWMVSVWFGELVPKIVQRNS